MGSLFICTECLYGNNEDWILKPIKNKIVYCPKCDNRFIFDNNLNLIEKPEVKDGR